MNIRKLLLFGLVAFAAITLIAAEAVSYTYDTAGRVTAVNYGFGKVTTFTYDATGNLLRSADTLVTDTDNDGMTDAWEQTYFLGLGRDGTGDFDNDGLSDVAEFLAGTLPNNPASLLRMEQTVLNTVVQTTVSWLSVSGKTYRVQFKDSLSDPGWNDLPGDVTATGTTANKTDTTTSGQPQRFYRVQVVP